jgi:hypothetical protein
MLSASPVFKFKTTKVICVREQGTAMLELVLSLPVYVIVALTMIDMTRLSYLAVTTQYIVSTEARSTSLAEYGRSSPVRRIRERIKSFGLNASQARIQVCPGAIPDCSPEEGVRGRGEPNEWAYIKVIQPVQLMSGAFIYTLQAGALYRNEPYEPRNRLYGDGIDDELGEEY